MAYPTYSPGASARASLGLLAFIFLGLIIFFLVIYMGVDFNKPMNGLLVFLFVLSLDVLLYLGLGELIKRARARRKWSIAL